MSFLNSHMCKGCMEIGGGGLLCQSGILYAHVIRGFLFITTSYLEMGISVQSQIRPRPVIPSSMPPVTNFLRHVDINIFWSYNVFCFLTSFCIRSIPPIALKRRCETVSGRHISKNLTPPIFPPVEVSYSGDPTCLISTNIDFPPNVNISSHGRPSPRISPLPTNHWLLLF